MSSINVQKYLSFDTYKQKTYRSNLCEGDTALFVFFHPGFTHRRSSFFYAFLNRVYRKDYHCWLATTFDNCYLYICYHKCFWSSCSDLLSQEEGTPMKLKESKTNRDEFSNEFNITSKCTLGRVD